MEKNISIKKWKKLNDKFFKNKRWNVLIKNKATKITKFEK